MQNGCAVKIVVSQSAREDLGQIWQFGAGRWSPVQADTYANMLFEAIFNWSDYPLNAPIDESLNYLNLGLFMISITSSICIP